MRGTESLEEWIAEFLEALVLAAFQLASTLSSGGCMY
jgi:hypothetical protein